MVYYIRYAIHAVDRRLLRFHFKRNHDGRQEQWKVVVPQQFIKEAHDLLNWYYIKLV